uniref:Glycosyl transferase CAP10 domain-containing protein n=1 Tax=Mantoniella antarctica TaxID=81844 RepID=A0A7S0SIL4_9CHLO|mmetsp:Transcript_24859/g.61956  ORF Transcript_24859/g.61956 Transcript_24859/m.61956 type:complete len:585 (+) Transcript_24859:62-1816(+)|eukprot:CAMPEP_0181363138 /NCGR_PEP_ID=MMETSP1106-20121128/8515_1 /TAXON_ID=81844 /ORGANISM="Mantoniella antarctica, Strain SL-175" /LENGTH=584 /DNA_ID=CAMNT_0023477409 /DNA_START=927 /DNA_END=2681 /DNA_ORIENTATION=-
MGLATASRGGCERDALLNDGHHANINSISAKQAQVLTYAGVTALACLSLVCAANLKSALGLTLTEGSLGDLYTTATIVDARAQWPDVTGLAALGWEPSSDTFSLIVVDVALEGQSPGKLGLSKRYRGKGTSRVHDSAKGLAALLREYHPERFAPGRQPFQILISGDDAPHLLCFKTQTCPPSTYLPPILNLGTDFRDPSMMPNLITLPTQPIFDCLAGVHFGTDVCPILQSPRTSREPCNGGHTHCDSQSLVVRSDVKLADLIPTLVWRGSDYGMVKTQAHGTKMEDSVEAVQAAIDTLARQNDAINAQSILDLLEASSDDRVTPRMRAVLMSEAATAAAAAVVTATTAGMGMGRTTAAETMATTAGETAAVGAEQINGRYASGNHTASASTPPPMDIKFFGYNKKNDYHEGARLLYNTLARFGINANTPVRMDESQMADYRYQIDLGGLGGTSWEGLYAKLAMPGLLFHHETTMIDFLLPDELQPYVHYVPVREDLADLTEKLAWAEANPIEAEKISRAGTAFVVKLPQMVERLLNKYVRDRTGAVMERYRHDGNLPLVESYIAAGVSLDRISTTPVKEFTPI